MNLNFLMVYKHRFPNFNCFSPDSSGNPALFQRGLQRIASPVRLSASGAGIAPKNKKIE